MIGPSRRPEPDPTKPRAAAPSAPAQTQRQPPRSHPEHPEHPAHPAHPEPRQPRVEVPDVTKAVPKDAQDVCALGKKYGRWRADSPEAVICRQTYGH
jgi:hypothetical protein